MPGRCDTDTVELCDDRKGDKNDVDLVVGHGRAPIEKEDTKAVIFGFGDTFVGETTRRIITEQTERDGSVQSTAPLECNLYLFPFKLNALQSDMPSMRKRRSGQIDE